MYRTNLSQTVVQTIPLSARDYSEDEDLHPIERECMLCGVIFMGVARRNVCKVCASCKKNKDNQL